MAPLSGAVRAFVYYTVFSAIVHFIGETWVHLAYGQFLPMLLVDYIAISLLLLGALGYLRWGWGPGLICGGWGFTFCLNYRALFWRVEAMLDGSADVVITNTAYVLGAALVLSAAAFLISVLICIADAKRSPIVQVTP
ncbi:MAG: hypothetical protein AAF993_21370 [Pseudomonadota bacterium]